MLNLHPSVSTLYRAIEDCYKVFEPYQALPLGEGSPISVTDRMRSPLETKALRMLETGDLSSFAFKTLTTWGNEDDLRHFLPRILELIAGEALTIWPYNVFFQKLVYGKWRTWPQAEQSAIENYCQALWRYILDVRLVQADIFTSEANSFLLNVNEIMDVQPYLKSWGESLNEILHLAKLVLFYALPYHDKATGILYHVEWLNTAQHLSSVRDWLRKDEHLTKIEQAFFNNPNSPLLPMAVDALFWTAKQKE